MKQAFLHTALCCLTMLGLAACSSDALTDENGQSEEPSQTTVTIRMQLGVTAFDATATRAANAHTWVSGETVFLQFKTGSATVSGRAVYQGNNLWEASFSGDIGTSGQCEAYFFEGVTTTQQQVSLTDATPVYADQAGSYSKAGQELTVTANLKPMTSRLRFKGTNGIGATLNGVTHYSGYNAATNQFTTNDAAVSRIVGSDQYSSYIYCNYTDPATRRLTLTNTIDGRTTFVNTFPATVLKQGESGYMTVPTSTNSRGWSVEHPSTITFSVTSNGKTVSFTMKRVEAGTFQMGSATGYSNEYPVHQVTLTRDYYMGETEVTQGLWQAVMGLKPTNNGSPWSSSYGLGDSYPAYYISWEDCQQFVTALNNLAAAQLSSGEKFRLPTEAEWEFAAKGGNQSRNYTYSGSNTIGDVAWYWDNSGSKAHIVKAKAPNELGLYDMSGNVWEWCQDWYATYSSTAQTDPTGPTTASDRVLRGGSWSGTADCRPSRRLNNTPSNRNNNFGFRLALQ